MTETSDETFSDQEVVETVAAIHSGVYTNVNNICDRDDHRHACGFCSSGVSCDEKHCSHCGAKNGEFDSKRFRSWVGWALTHDPHADPDAQDVHRAVAAQQHDCRTGHQAFMSWVLQQMGLWADVYKVAQCCPACGKQVLNTD